MCLKFSDLLLKNNSFIKMFWTAGFSCTATDKTISDQVYRLISDLPIYEPLVQWYDHPYDSADLGSIPGRVNFLKIEIFNSYDIFTCSGVYIDTFELKSSQPLWFSGSVSVN